MRHTIILLSLLLLAPAVSAQGQSPPLSNAVAAIGPQRPDWGGYPAAMIAPGEVVAMLFTRGERKDTEMELEFHNAAQANQAVSVITRRVAPEYVRGATIRCAVRVSTGRDTRGPFAYEYVRATLGQAPAGDIMPIPLGGAVRGRLTTIDPQGRILSADADGQSTTLSGLSGNWLLFRWSTTDPRIDGLYAVIDSSNRLAGFGLRVRQDGGLIGGAIPIPQNDCFRS